MCGGSLELELDQRQCALHRAGHHDHDASLVQVEELDVDIEDVISLRWLSISFFLSLLSLVASAPCQAGRPGHVRSSGSV